MRANFELENIWAARLRVVRLIVDGHESRITALETKTPPPQPSRSPRSSISWKRLITIAKRLAVLGKALFSAASFLFRHGGIILAAITMAWAFILPVLKAIWRLITGFIGYVVGVGIGV